VPANPSLLGQTIDLATGDALEVRRSDVTPTQLLKALAPLATGGSAHVPCGSCTACCWYGRTDVRPEEETLATLAALRMEEDERGLYLQRRADGGCIHLDPHGGCGVHAHRPRVCRAYDCRVLGLGGLAPAASRGHVAPVWDFPLETPLDRAILLAARLATHPYIEACQKGEADPPGNVLVAILKGIYDQLPYARKLIAVYDALPEEEQRKFQELGQNLESI
jgi:hypothetical protein